MKQVIELETFGEIRHAFSRTRTAGDTFPVIEEEAMLEIDVDTLTLTGTKRFILSDEMRRSGREYLTHCVQHAMGERVNLDSLFAEK